MTRLSLDYRFTLLILAILLTLNPVCFAQRPQGTVVVTNLTSPALEGNALGHSANREARVYLPPSYFDTGNRRYPVLYYLHGSFSDENQFYEFNGSRTADRLFRDGSIEEMIVVGVDASGGQPISSYINSELNGNYDDYVVQDLVPHIDSVFRTIPDRDSRGVFGASMGGFGTYFYAMTHADVFGSAYSISTGFPVFSRPDIGFPYLGEEVAQPSLASELLAISGPTSIPGNDAGWVYAVASAFSPNLDNLPFRVDLPFELPSMKVIPEIRDKWYAYDAFLMLEQHAEDLASLRGLALDVGNAEGNLAANEAIHQALTDEGIEHQFEVFDGGHIDKLDERIGVALTFLSESLLVPDCDRDGLIAVRDIDCALAEGSQVLASVILEEIGSPPGDFDEDGHVQFNDFLILSANFGEPGLYTEGDIDFSGMVDFRDFLTLADNFGQNSAAAVMSVPEATCDVAAAVALMILSSGWRTRRLDFAN